MINLVNHGHTAKTVENEVTLLMLSMRGGGDTVLDVVNRIRVSEHASHMKIKGLGWSLWW